MMTEREAWLRRDTESNPAYEAFRSYMTSRSTTKVAEELGKSLTLITRWCGVHQWVSRIAEYDRYIATADTDGLVHQLAATRDKNLALMDKLRTLLDSRLDDFIERRMDPTTAWTKAVEAMARVEANSLLMGKDTSKTSESVERVEKLLGRLEEVEAGR